MLQGTHLRDVLLKSFSPEHVHLPQTLQEPDNVDYPSHQKLDHGITVGKGESGYEEMGAFRDDMRIQSWARRYAEIDPVVVEGDPDLSGLNRTQIRALAMMIGQRISLIQGASCCLFFRGVASSRHWLSASGDWEDENYYRGCQALESKCIAYFGTRCLEEERQVHFEVPHPLLVCTYTNVAVDNLVEGLVAAGVKPLRVGFGERVRPSLLKHTLDYQIQAHPLQKVLIPLIKEEKKLQERFHEMSSTILNARESATYDVKALKKYDRLQIKRVSLERQLMAVRAKKYAAEQEMLQDVVKKADVVRRTCFTLLLLIRKSS